MELIDHQKSGLVLDIGVRKCQDVVKISTSTRTADEPFEGEVECFAPSEFLSNQCIISTA